MTDISEAKPMDSYLYVKAEEEKEVQDDSEISALDFWLPFVELCPWLTTMLNTL